MRRLLLVAMVAAVSCGPRKGPVPGDTYFWQLDGSAVEWGPECSDNASFRKSAQPLEIGADTYIVYRVDAAGRTATTQSCARVDPASCTPSDSGVVFDIAGAELTFVETLKGPIGTTGCQLQQDTTWTLLDQIATMSLDIGNVLSLVDHPTACADAEAGLKANSPNGIGVTGCVVTFKLTGKLR